MNLRHANGSSTLFAFAALMILPAVPATAQITVTASSPDGRWKATKAGQCIAVLSSGDQIHLQNLRDRKLTWEGSCDAAGLADGEGILTLTYRFVENGTSYPGKTEQRITFRNGLLDGTGTQIFHDRPSHPDGKAGSPNAPWKVKQSVKAIYRSGCEYVQLYDSQRPARFCEEAKGAAFRDTLRATAALPAQRAAVPPSASSPPATSAGPRRTTGASDHKGTDLAALRSLAEQGDAAAQDEMGERYFAGKGVTRDSAEAVRWYRRAAEQGLASAQNRLGVRYSNGVGIQRDDAEALRWYRLAADQGHPGGQRNVGFMYENGRAVPQDYAAAMQWYRRAADQGYDEAQVDIGLMHSSGLGIPRNYPEAAQWFRRAADQGLVRGQLLLAIAYYFGGEGLPRDYAIALQWYRRAADQGNALAQSRIGDMHRTGTGVPQDFVQAAQWYRQAAEKGYADAQYRLGVAYIYGQGVPKDEVQAAQWVRRAADQNHAVAQTELGYMYDHGLGVPKDLAQAVHWFRRAVKNDPKYQLAVDNLRKAEAVLQQRQQQAQQQQQQQQQAEAERARRQAAERQAGGRLAAGALTALLGGNSRQVQQALSGQQVTPAPRPRPAPAPMVAAPLAPRSPTPVSPGIGAGMSGDRSRVIAADGRSAMDCVSLITVAKGDSRLSGGGRILANNCGGPVEITWCYVDTECGPGRGNMWTLGAGRSWPVSATREVRWAACHGANTVSFEKGSAGLRYICRAPLR